MLFKSIISQDINTLCQLIDQNSDQNEMDQFSNFTISESLAYISRSFMPIINQYKKELLEEEDV